MKRQIITLAPCLVTDILFRLGIHYHPGHQFHIIPDNGNYPTIPCQMIPAIREAAQRFRSELSARTINQIYNTTKIRNTQEKKEVKPVEHIKTFREAAGLNQTELARKLGINPSAVSIMEMPGRYPEARRLPDIADALDCSIDALFGRGLSDAVILPREGGIRHGA